LLERVVVDGPGEKLPLAVAGRGREIQLRGQTSGCRRVQSTNDLVPLAFLIMRVVGLIVSWGLLPAREGHELGRRTAQGAQS
jgi:hypothetical protein